MKTDASVEIVRWQGNELTVRLPGEIDKKQMDFYIQHRRELYKRNMKKNAPFIIRLLNCCYPTSTKNAPREKIHKILSCTV